MRGFRLVFQDNRVRFDDFAEILRHFFPKVLIVGLNSGIEFILNYIFVFYSADFARLNQVL